MTIEKHKPEPLTNGSMWCRFCGRQINVVRERAFSQEEIEAEGRYGSVLTYRHNPPRGVPHPRRAKR